MEEGDAEGVRLLSLETLAKIDDDEREEEIYMLAIRVQANSSYSDDPGDAIGTIQFAGQHGEVNLKLNSEQCRRIIAIVADVAVEYAHEISKALKSELIEARPAPEKLAGPEE